MKARERRRLTVQTIEDLMHKPALTLREAADVLDTTTALLWRRLRKGKGPAHFRLGRITYIRTAKLKEWLQQLEAEQGGTPPNVDAEPPTPAPTPQAKPTAAPPKRDRGGKTPPKRKTERASSAAPALESAALAGS